MNKLRALMFFCGLLAVLLCGCDANTIVDSNLSMPARNWNYANKVKTVIEIKDTSKPVSIYFKLRHTNDYRYSNIFVLFRIKAGGQKTQTRRYEYKLAQPDGQWNGSGSGNLYTYVMPLLTNYKFPAAGKYLLEIEQNMRDNPLREISDAGIKVVSLEQGK
jgi:gliding motility-associated lipoprotein GldH